MIDERPPTVRARQPHAIHSALTVLETVAKFGAGVSAREISFELGLPRATAYRLLSLLVEDGYLARSSDNAGYELGSKVEELAIVVTPPAQLVAAAREIVRAARARVRGGIHVIQYTEARAILVDRDPDFPFKNVSRLVKEPERLAVGRLLLHERGIDHAWATAAAADMELFGATRQRGELTPDFGCLAVPIRSADGALVGAVGFSGSRDRVDDPDDLLGVLVPVSRALSPLIA